MVTAGYLAFNAILMNQRCISIPGRYNTASTNPKHQTPKTTLLPFPPLILALSLFQDNPSPAFPPTHAQTPHQLPAPPPNPTNPAGTRPDPPLHHRAVPLPTTNRRRDGPPNRRGPYAAGGTRRGLRLPLRSRRRRLPAGSTGGVAGMADRRTERRVVSALVVRGRRLVRSPLLRTTTPRRD